MVRKVETFSLLDDLRLSALWREKGWNNQHLKKLWNCLIKRGATSAADVDLMPKAVVSGLADSKFTLLTTTVVSETTSHNASTTKLLIRLQDGHLVESVIMRYTNRASLCISSQIGCRMACRFCSTGTMGLRGHLNCGEMLEQLVHANRITPIRNVVFMGMGEPLDNYDEVLHALKAMVDPSRFGLSPGRITVSTVGMVPRIRSLAKDLPGVALALSLHAPNQELRCKIVPTARAWPLPVLIAAVDEYTAATGDAVLIEYVVIGNVNDSPALAHELGALLAGKKVLVNLIPYNPSTVPDKLDQPLPSAVVEFKEIVMTYGLFTTIRREFGQDIAGACGQLVVNFEASEKSAAMMDVGADDVEEKGSAGSACGGAGGGSCDDSHAHPAIPVASIAPAPPADIEDFAGPKPPRGEVVPSSRRSVAPAAAPNPLVMPAKSEQVIPAPPPSNTSLSLLEAVSWLLLLIGIAGILVRMLPK